jgi:hypothetical protein
MSLDITQRPQQTISGEASNWNAVGNPIVYKMQRRDYDWTVLSDNAGFARILIFGVDVTVDFPTGTEVRVIGDAGTIDFTSTVTGTSYSGGSTYVTFSEPYTVGSSANGLANILDRSLYRVEVNLYDSNDVLLNSDPVTYSPDADWDVTINVSAILLSVLSEDFNLSVTSIQEDSHGYKDFKIGYTEVWTDSANSETVDSNVFYAIYGAMQIPSAYGGNMAEYVTFHGGTLFPFILSKLGVNFSNPGKMWRGYPFFVSLISGDDLSGNATDFTVYYYDEQWNIISSQTSSSSDNSGQLLVLNPSSILSIPANAKHMQFSFQETSPSQPLITAPRFDIIDACKNPVYLMTRNSFGGILPWMFDQSQEYTFDYGDGRKAKRLVLASENLSILEWEALQDFIGLGEVYKNNIVEFTSSTNKTSSRIGKQVYQVYPDGSKIGVIVIPTVNSTLTRYLKHEFQIEIEYPEEFSP